MKKLPDLFLEKLELLTEREREVLIESVRLFNKPIFIISGEEKTEPPINELD